MFDPSVLIGADTMDDFVRELLRVSDIDHRPGYYFSNSRKEYVLIKDMNRVHATNALRKLIREGGCKETIEELRSHCAEEKEGVGNEVRSF